MFCQKCGSQVAEGVKFCPSCGYSAQPPHGNPGAQPPLAHAAYSPQSDAQQNKAMAIIAYFIFFIPLLAAKESKFARYHANQGLLLAMLIVALNIVVSIISSIFISTLSLGMLGIISVLWLIIWISYIALAIIGIINASQGKMKPLPVIGKLFTIIK